MLVMLLGSWFMVQGIRIMLVGMDKAQRTHNRLERLWCAGALLTRRSPLTDLESAIHPNEDRFQLGAVAVFLLQRLQLGDRLGLQLLGRARFLLCFAADAV